MGREALLIANSAVAQDIQKSVTRSVLRRTVGRFETLLRSLDESHSFNVKTLLDETPQKTKTELEAAARRATRDDALLLLYYFGHGDLTGDYDLQLIYPSSKRTERQALKITALEGILHDADCKKSLSILDCCYAGAAEKNFHPTLRTGQHCRLSSTTPTTRSLVRTVTGEPPVGTFTQAILDGFSTSDACISNADNSVNAESLFRYADRVTRELTAGVQQPQLYGRLDEVLFEYVPTPQIIPGYNESAGEKTAYAKVYAICSTLLERGGFDSISELYRAVLAGHRHRFLTPFKTADGTLEYHPAKPDAIRRYVRFLRSLGLLDDAALRLTSQGRAVVRAQKSRYNHLLVDAAEAYLRRQGLSRDRVERALRDILAFRGVPSRREVFDRLMRVGHRLPTAELGIVLDILGYAGALRMTTEKAYFPW